MGIRGKLDRASIFYKQQDFDAATVILEKILEKKPNLFDAQQLLALTLHGQQKLEAAILIFKKMIERNPSHAASFNNLANVYNDLGQVQLAERHYLTALGIDGNYADAYNNLANVQLKVGKKIEAEKNYRKAIFTDMEKAEYYLNLGVLLGEQGKFEEALECHLKVLELDVSQSSVYFHIFNNFMFLHRYQDALEFADIGLVSNQLDDFQLCELLIGKAILFWLFDNDEEGQQAINLSEQIHTITAERLNLKNHRVFHTFIKELLTYRLQNKLEYKTSKQQPIYFLSESHGFAVNGMTVEHENNEHTVKSLFITGAKIFHFIQDAEHKCKASLNILLNGIPKGSCAVLGFGEIDCRLNEGIFHYCNKYNKDYQQIINAMVVKYIRLLKAASKENDLNIIVYGVPAPHPIVLNGIVEEEQETFKQLVAYFNQQLTEVCHDNNIPFLDVYGLTNIDGVSNLKYHCDAFHVKPSTVPALFNELIERENK